MLRSLILFLIILALPHIGFAYHKESHSSITYGAVDLIRGTIDLSLESSGITNGINTALNDISSSPDTPGTIIDFIRYGGFMEDEPTKEMRFISHFHNPLNDLGLNDGIAGHSSYIWANRSDNLWSWQNARNSYYSGLTTATKANRNNSLASTFRSLGQVMHLIQDKAVPAHVRNDGHLFKDPYEIYVEMHHLDLFQNKPVEYDGSLGSGTDAPRQLWDSDQYDGSNPMITLIPNIGLSEFTNANFLSKDTIFTENNLSDLFPLNDHHAFPYPRLDNTALYTEPTSETWNELPVLHRYFEKTGAGVSVKHFARGGRLVGPMCVFGAPPPSVITLDDKCHADYAALLLPRAVGYSAALLQYFFRIDIALAAPPEHPGKLALKNNTDEELKGTFTVYAEDAAGNRWPLSQDGSWTLTVPARGEVLLTPFLPPLPAPVRYLLVFRGRSGAEDNAVAAGPVTLAEAPLSVVGRTSRQLYEVTNSGSVALDGTLRLDYLGLDGQRHTAADGVWPLALAPGKSLEVAPFTPPDDARVVDEYQLVFSGRVAGESSGLLTRMAVVPPIGRGWFEEWDGNTLRTNHPWLTTGQELLRQNQDNGSTANRVEGSLLVKENLRGAGSTAARVNQTWIGEAWPGTGGTFCMTEYNEFCQPDDFGIEFPLPISADTMVRVKIDELTQSEPIPKPTCATTTPGIGAYQGLILTFDNGMRVAFTVPGQEPPNSWLTYVTPGRELSFNLLTEFARVGIDVSRPLQLMSINLSQQLGGLCSPAVNDQWQRMAVDYLHFEE